MITVEQALDAILEQIRPLGTERVNILAARGRVLAEDIISGLNVPPHDNSGMDGYAVRYADIEDARPDHPARLSVAGDLAAGSVAAAALQSGQALRIMTGAPIPAGADTVVKKEDTILEGDIVGILSAGRCGLNVRCTGEDINMGAQVFTRGALLRPAHLGVLASIKRAVVSVYQRPQVAILSTGEELVDIDGDLAPGKIVTSNSYALAGLVADSGAEPVMLGIARDTRQCLQERLREAMRSDVIVTSGGVSVGDYDLVKDVLQDMGMDMKFWKVAMRPGQPLAFGTIGNRPTFGLPGNPVAAMISFEQFARPALRKMGGYAQLFRKTVEAAAAETIETKTGRKYFLRCRLTSGSGGYSAITTGEQGSGILRSMTEADGLMIVADDVGTVQPGDRVKVQILDPNFGFTETPDY